MLFFGGTYNYFCFIGKEFTIKKVPREKRRALFSLLHLDKSVRINLVRADKHLNEIDKSKNSAETDPTSKKS